MRSRYGRIRPRCIGGSFSCRHARSLNATIAYTQTVAVFHPLVAERMGFARRTSRRDDRVRVVLAINPATRFKFSPNHRATIIRASSCCADP
ncbi:MAG: hypothetical protein QOJ15_5873 [Bradyrhizobium sp.]|jgi:hypothetical protein|nr:hypothetical protein [Bradyrhizobium sp.]